MHVDDVDPVNDFDAQLAQMMAVDFVVSVDNTVAHAAGAPKQKSLLLLNTPPEIPNAYLFGGDTVSPVYPRQQVIRSSASAEWDNALATVENKLSTAKQNQNPIHRSSVMILNFTERSGHWGMFGTSMAIAERYVALGYNLDVLDVHKVHELFSPPIPH